MREIRCLPKDGSFAVVELDGSRDGGGGSLAVGDSADSEQETNNQELEFQQHRVFRRRGGLVGGTGIAVRAGGK